MSPPRLGGLRAKIVDRVPVPFLTSAHELFLGFACAVIGVAVVVQEARPGSITSQVPAWMVAFWGWSILLGGSTTWVGIFRPWPRIEWSGQLLIGYGCAFYSTAVGTALPFAQGAVVVVVFGGLAATSWWRSFKITSQPLVQARLNREAIKAGQRVHQERRMAR